MYDDPKRVRRPYGRVNLDEYESRLIDAVAEFTGVERAALLLELWHLLCSAPPEITSRQILTRFCTAWLAALVEL